MKSALTQLAKKISVSEEVILRYEKLLAFLDSLDWEHASSQQCRWSTSIKNVEGETEVALYIEAKIKETEGGEYRDSPISLRPLRVSKRRKYFFFAPLECSVKSTLVERLRDEYVWLKEPIEIGDNIEPLIESLESFQFFLSLL